MNAHAAVGGKKRGRRFEVVALNRAAILLLSAHLEGYLEDLMAEALGKVESGLSPGRLNQTFSNPTTANINSLFGFLGMEKPCDSISWQGGGNEAVKKNLNQLVERRNQVAHGATSLKVYKDDVTRYRNYVEGFAKRFDDLVRDRLTELTGKAPWSKA